MVLFRGSDAREQIVQRSGVVGFQIPTLREQVLPIAPDDILVLATDGFSSRFAEYVPGAATPEEIAQDILRAYGRADDNALVLAARHRGDRHD